MVWVLYNITTVRELGMYSRIKRMKAMKLYSETGSVTEVIRVLGYPTRRTLYNWLEEEGEQDGKASPFRIGGRSERAAHMTDDLRKEALRRCFENGENVGKVAKEIGCSRASIYNWKKKFGE